MGFKYKTNYLNKLLRLDIYTYIVSQNPLTLIPY